MEEEEEAKERSGMREREGMETQAAKESTENKMLMCCVKPSVYFS